MSNYTEEYTIRQQKANDFAAKLAQSNLKVHEEKLAYNAMWESKVRYISPVVTFSRQQWGKIQAPIVNALLQKLTINQHFPRTVVFATHKVGGLGIIPHYITQGYEMVKFVMSSFHLKKPILHLLSMSYQLVQLECGVLTPILAWNTPVPTYINSQLWWIQLWKFLLTVKGTLKIPNKLLMKEQRDGDGDGSIMELPHRNSKKQLQVINSCRLHLKALLISDIVTNDGNTITEEAWQGISQCQSRWTWPVQPKPPKKSWMVWRKFLKYGLSLDGRELLSPLGKWRIRIPHKIYSPVWIPTKKDLFLTIQGQWQVHKFSTIRQQIHIIESTNNVGAPPIEGIPLDLAHHNSNTVGTIPKYYPVQNTSPWCTHLAPLKITSNECNIIGEFLAPDDNYNEVINALQQDNLIIAGDGSLKEQHGSYGFIMTKINGDFPLKGGGGAV